jgi:primosomal protein N' (replication factor Y)
VVVLAELALPVVQALIRWDPAGYSERELAERAELRFPPAARMASLTGPAAAVSGFAAALALPPGGEVLGPVPAGTEESGHQRALLRVPRPEGAQLAHALRDAQASRTARKDPDPVRVQLDPLELA